MGMVFSNKYEELGQLGQGGMGVVYKVRHLTLETISALKVLPAHLMEDKDLLERFYREARLMARLQHANIVRVIDIDRDERQGLYYFVMEYIQGRPLKQYLQDRGPLPLSEVLEIGCQVARALVYAHRQTPPVIHRDIKPGNIMVEDPGRRVVVLDFGIAKQLEEGSQFTQQVGTPRYCAPEQLLGNSLTGSADVYSLGLVLYEMLTGRQFFAGAPYSTIMAQALDTTQDYHATFPPTVPPALADAINKAIAKSPEKRYPTMLDFVKDLEVQRREIRGDGEAATILVRGERAGARPVDAKAMSSSAAEAKPVPRSLAEERERLPSEERKPELARNLSRAERDPSHLSKPGPARVPNDMRRIFTVEGTLDRARFTDDAFRLVVATTGESRSVGDTRIAPFHLFISLTRGPYLRAVTQYLESDSRKDAEAKQTGLTLRGINRPQWEAVAVLRASSD